MQKVQVGGGYISPAVVKHVQRSVVSLQTTASKLKPVSTNQFGGGVINPAIKRHVTATAKINLGGGYIHPSIAKHVLSQ